MKEHRALNTPFYLEEKISMIRRKFSFVAVAVLSLASFVVAGDAAGVKSGIQVGGQVPAFVVKDITGPAKGKEALCYRCRYQNSPVVAVFARSLDEKTGKLIAQIDQLVTAKKDDNLKGFVVIVADDTDAFEPKLTKLAADRKISSTPLTVFKGAEGPADYEISKDADVTILMWVRGEVKVNHAFAPGKVDDKVVASISKDIEKILVK